MNDCVDIDQYWNTYSKRLRGQDGKYVSGRWRICCLFAVSLDDGKLFGELLVDFQQVLILAGVCLKKVAGTLIH